MTRDNDDEQVVNHQDEIDDADVEDEELIAEEEAED